MRRMLKKFGVSLAILVGVALLAGAWVLATQWSTERRAHNALLERAPVLEVEGRRLRDLNRNGLLDPYENPAAPIEVRVQDLIGQMTLEEKVGLMLHPFIRFEPGGKVIEGMDMVTGAGTLEAVTLRHIRHVALQSAGTAQEMASWHNEVQELAERTRLGIPVTVSTDPRHSFRHTPGVSAVQTEAFSRWPEPIGFGAIADAALVEEFAQIVNREYRAVGIRTALHPMADLATEPRWARIVGTFGEDAELAAALTHGYVRGLQGDEIDSQSVLAMTKHFPGGGPQDDGWDAHFVYGGDQAYPGGNFDAHLVPFEAAFAAGTAQIMPYYGVPVGQTSEDVGMGFNRDIITGLLRDKYAFDGVVCTDWFIVSGRGPMMPPMAHGVRDLSIPDRFAKALDAGVDQFGGEFDQVTLAELVTSGRIEEARIDRSVTRILRDKFRLGLFADPYVDIDRASERVARPEYVKAGAIAQRRANVLLKNAESDGRRILPLERGRKIYVEGIAPAVARQYGSVVETLAEAEVAIVRLAAPFDPPRKTWRIGQNALERIFHQGDLDFDDEELQRLLDVARSKPTVFSIFLERPAVIPELADAAEALLANFGAEDDAVLDVVFGAFPPTGRLPFDLPSSMAAVREQHEDVPFDTKDPLYRFGDGLRYDGTPLGDG